MTFFKTIKTLVHMYRNKELDAMIEFINDARQKRDNISKHLNVLSQECNTAHTLFGNIANDVVKQTFNQTAKQSDQTLHTSFQDVYRVVLAGCSPFLVGPAGSGKSTILSQVANAIDVPFYPMSVNALTSDYNIIGYNDANGHYVSTGFREAYENGGLFSFEEIDAGNPNVLTVINNAMSQNTYMFPDKIVKKHDKFIMAASGNTYGNGGTIQYVGRNPLDAATLDRFATIYVDYDIELENRLCANTEWLKFVRSVREFAGRREMKLIVSTRALLNGQRLINMGFDLNTAAHMLIFKGLSQSEINSIMDSYTKQR